MDASKCITNRPKTNYIKDNYDNKTELSLKYQNDMAHLHKVRLM